MAEILEKEEQELQEHTGLSEDEAQRLREENERLREEIERVKQLPLKERLYDHVHVSVRTLDIFICVMIVLAVLAVVFGMAR